MRGLNAAFFWLDEGVYCGYEAWRVMKARLRQAGFPVQGWLTSTPRGQDQFFADFEAAPLADHRLVRAATRANVFLPLGYAESLGYTGTHALQELEGQFVAREGLVYRLEGGNVAPAPPVSEMELVIGGIDWGYRNPFHLSVFGARGGVVHQMAEFRATGADRERVVIPAVLSLTAQYHVQMWYAGPDRPENIAALNERLRAAGRPAAVRAGDNNVVAGIETVRGLLESAPPRLVIDPACTHTLREFGEYHYPDEVGPGNGAALFDEHPVKAQDHALDALRYALHSHFGGERHARSAGYFIGQLQRRVEAESGAGTANTKATKPHEGQEKGEIDSG